MSALLDATLKHLAALVGFDTRNPPRTIDTGGIFDYLRAQLPGFGVTVTDFGAGAVALHAVRGQPKVLFNVHLDTVPDSPAWTADPHTLRVTADRAIGLGACDIKGAAAALLAVAKASDGDLALLFTTDEEANDARCIAGFLRKPHAYDAVIVAEPTRGEAVLAHRGIQSVLMRFAGRAGHASGEQQPGDSALHQAVRWGNAALDFVAAQSHERFGGLTGLRFNIGRIEGGIKANMIAPTAEVRFGFRALPTMNPDHLLIRFRNLVEPQPVEFAETFRGASLPAGDTANAEANRLVARDLADELGIPVGNAVDFWTEAALFSAAGYTAFVYGPGDIAQAHSADEWVALDQLERYAQTVYRIIEKSGQGRPVFDSGVHG
ncbi:MULTISPECIES: acetylornithine deacetylase [Rhodanobacter]|uniref:acetylornithine deacetylase n=1 Tax=Rhodanobacter TaxID=75309 RepID=UPI000424AD7A|nr:MULTISPECIES: acetylornithine deacetylase [Rhodanobacter]UJJ52260.1 acetylornithine deacetylase [Rhodanobacter denitrificans]UJM95007.1 acetylornithine deacetylase [Rhodanobacter denitrificans]UJM98538.1 acetylornithine deacetylase [Rhodanobacter denitrificans]UJN22048.1 acetylornithine deacetylase [Rhodanobacter denitrificans]